MNDLPTVSAAPLSSLSALLADPDKLRDFPIETLERMYEMDSAMRARQAEIDFADSFRRAQNEIGPVARKGRNDHTRSRYARIEDVKEEIDPIIAAHGFSYSLSMADGAPEGFHRIALRVRHCGGHAETYTMDAPCDHLGPAGKPAKTVLHGMASMLTYCQRHLLCNVWGVQTVADDDGNAAGAVGPGSERVSAAQLAELQKVIDAVGGVDVPAMCRWLKVDSLADIPAGRFAEAMAGLARKIAKNRTEQTENEQETLI